MSPLVDRPHPIPKMLKEAGDGSGELDADRLSGVALTRLHASRSSGLDGIRRLGYGTARRRLTHHDPDELAPVQRRRHPV